MFGADLHPNATITCSVNNNAPNYTPGRVLDFQGRRCGRGQQFLSTQSVQASSTEKVTSEKRPCHHETHGLPAGSPGTCRGGEGQCDANLCTGGTRGAPEPRRQLSASQEGAPKTPTLDSYSPE